MGLNNRPDFCAFSYLPSQHFTKATELSSISQRSLLANPWFQTNPLTNCVQSNSSSQSISQPQPTIFPTHLPTNLQLGQTNNLPTSLQVIFFRINCFMDCLRHILGPSRLDFIQKKLCASIWWLGKPSVNFSDFLVIFPVIYSFLLAPVTKSMFWFLYKLQYVLCSNQTCAVSFLPPKKRKSSKNHKKQKTHKIEKTNKYRSVKDPRKTKENRKFQKNEKIKKERGPSVQQASAVCAEFHLYLLAPLKFEACRRGV